MTEYPYLASVEFSVSVPATPWDDYEFFTLEIDGTMIVVLGDTEEAEAGTVKLLRVQVTEAVNRGFDLFEVCDAYSDFLVTLYSALFHKGSETKDELEIEPAWDDLLVLVGYEVEPRYRKLIVEAFETAIAAFGSQGIVAAAREGEEYSFVGLDLTVEEWRRLGFKRIAGSQFVFRDNCCTNPYRGEDQAEQNG